MANKSELRKWGTCDICGEGWATENTGDGRAEMYDPHAVEDYLSDNKMKAGEEDPYVGHVTCHYACGVANGFELA